MTVGEMTPRHGRRNLVLVLIVVLFAGFGLWRYTHAKPSGGAGGYGGGGGSGAAGGRRGGGRPATTVGIAKAINADVPVTLSAIGTVQPVVAATVRTQLNGTIFTLNFREGQRVAKGQLIAQIDPRPYQLQLAQAQSAAARDQAQLNAARVDLGRYQTLLQQDSIARQQVDTQAALVKQLEGTVGTDQAAVGTARLNLNYTAIKAPVSGTVGLRQVDIGNYVTAGDANGIVVVTQSDPIDVTFALPQAQLPQVQGRVAEGGAIPVDALDQAGGQAVAHGHFLTFDNQIDASTGTVRAKARFANPGDRLFPNQFVNVALLVDTLRNAVVVPVTAVRNGAQGDFVFVVKPDKTVKLTKVRSGPQAEGKVAILAGLSAGQTVVTEGADRLDDGASVTLPGDKPRGGVAGGRRGGGGQGRSAGR